MQIAEAFTLFRTSMVYRATAHRNHDTADNSSANLAAWWQRCHLLHAPPKHLRRQLIMILRRWAIGDLFFG